MTSKETQGICAAPKKLLNQIQNLFFIVTPMVAIKLTIVVGVKIRRLSMMIMQYFLSHIPNSASCVIRMSTWDQGWDTEHFGG